MLIIRKNQVNNIIATVSMNKTLPNPYYLFSFQNIASKERISFIPEVITSNVRYDKFRFIETGNVNLSAIPPQVWFGNDLGQWYYSIYEQVSSGNTNIALAYNKLESGRAILMVGNDTNDCFFEPYISNDEDFSNIIYVSEEEELCISADTTISVFSQVVSFSATPMNSVQYLCDGNFVNASYGTNQTNLTDLIDMFNSVPSVNPPYSTFLDYGISYDNGDGRVRMEIPASIYTNLCSGGTITLNVIYD